MWIMITSVYGRVKYHKTSERTGIYTEKPKNKQWRLINSCTEKQPKLCGVPF